jgi:MFS family permease
MDGRRSWPGCHKRYYRTTRLKGIPGPQTNQRWLMLAVSVFAQMAVSMSFFPGLAAIAPVLVGSYRLSLLQTGLLFSAMQLGPVLTIALWGIAADRRGDRFVLALGLVSGAFALAAATLIHSYAVLITSLGVASMLTASTNVASTRAAAGWFSTGERGLALGIRQMAVPLGGATAAIVLPALTMRQGVNGTFIALAILCAVAGVLAFVMVREPAIAVNQGRVVDGPRIWRDRRLWRLAFGAGLLVLCQNSMLAYLVLFLTGYRHLSLQAAALAFLATQVVGSVMRVVLGSWSDRIGARVKPIRWIALALAGAVLVTSASVDLPIAFLVPVVVLATILSMGSTGLAYTVTAEIAGFEQAGRAIGFEITLFAITGTIAPVAFGLATTLLGWHSAFALLAVFAAGGWLTLRRLAILEDLGWSRWRATADLAAVGQAD